MNFQTRVENDGGTYEINLCFNGIMEIISLNSFITISKNVDSLITLISNNNSKVY